MDVLKLSKLDTLSSSSNTQVRDMMQSTSKLAKCGGSSPDNLNLGRMRRPIVERDDHAARQIQKLAIDF